MSENSSGWPSHSAGGAKPGEELAKIAPLAGVDQPATRDHQGRFLSGNIGGGRKAGSRNRLTETFLAAIESDFAEHGSDALAKVRSDDPAAYLRIVASLVPRDMILKREQAKDYSELGLAELEDILSRERHNGRFTRMVQQARHGG